MAENDQNMPEPALKYMRTPEESSDVFLSWRREDMVFFLLLARVIFWHILRNYNHLRAPEYFLELPWKRSYDYIHKLPSAAPEPGVA